MRQSDEGYPKPAPVVPASRDAKVQETLIRPGIPQLHHERVQPQTRPRRSAAPTPLRWGEHPRGLVPAPAIGTLLRARVPRQPRPLVRLIRRRNATRASRTRSQGCRNRCRLGSHRNSHHRNHRPQHARNRRIHHLRPTTPPIPKTCTKRASKSRQDSIKTKQTQGTTPVPRVPSSQVQSRPS